MGKILIVDDDQDFLAAVRYILEQAGYHFIATADSLNFRQKVRSYRPDLIILDVLLGQEDGRDLTAELKASPDTKSIPVLLISAHRAISQFSRSSGADLYLHKPFSGQELISSVHHLIS